MGIIYPIGILLVIVIAALVAFSTGYFVGPTATVVIAAVIDVFTGWGGSHPFQLHFWLPYCCRFLQFILKIFFIVNQLIVNPAHAGWIVYIKSPLAYK